MKTNEVNPLPPSFRDSLKREFELRSQKNRSYSLRSFARDLQIAPSSLSEILSGSKGLSSVKASSIATCLGWQGEVANQFIDQVIVECSRNQVKKIAAQKRLSARGVVLKTKEISLENIQLISDPTHYVIYAMTGLDEFQSDPEWIAKKLGISSLQVRLILERLIHLKLVTHQNKKYVANYSLVHSTEGVPSEAVKKAHETILNRAIEALYVLPLEEREFKNVIFPMNQNDLDEMKLEIKSFYRNLVKKYSGVSKKDSVVSMSLQVVPWVRAKQKNGSKS